MGKFRDIASIVVICLLAVVLLASSAQARPASVLLQEGLYAEEIEGDLDAAIRIYEQIAADKSAGARYAAQAMYRLGLCYQKKQDYQNAKATFEKLIARFPKEKSIIEKVQPLLDQMSAQDPAALMPAETLVYLEFGSPGKQIEAILNMLKGTPLANPLNLINAPEGPGVGIGPAGALVALLNPSMITEFKKIRGVAIGLEAIRSNNPPGVAVIYPGESDALRGMIIAGLGMAFQAGEPIAGMQTLRMDVQGGAAYDDNVIILASPIDRLTWCVKQYKGITNEPTLVSQNKAFQKLSRKQREQNAVTIWADVDKVFPIIKEEMLDDHQRALIESIGDIGNVDEFTTSLSLEEDGLAVETNIGFKDGHSCLAYDLIRTPNITKAGFEAVPPEAVAVVSFALSESEGGGVAGALKALKKLTGLDIGRELFANIEQITLFALPPTPTSTKNVLAESISPVVPCLGLAVTSHNPKRTEQLVTQLLTLTDLVMGISKGEEMVEQRYPAVGEYKIGVFNGQPAYCYVGQAGKSTVLTLSPEVLQASLSAVESKTSASSAGPLREVLSQLLPGTSKLVAVNYGGAIKLANVHICESHGVSADPEKNYFSQLLGQLAQACDETYAVVRTDEKANNFGLNVNISGLPDVGQTFPLVAQIPGALENPMLTATRPRPADKAMVRPAKAVELRWEPGGGATAHKVYFGTSIDNLSLLGEVKRPGYDKLPAPERGVTYYWRVDEVMVDGSIITGDIWQFSPGNFVGWWKLDNDAKDSSGSNHHGTVKGDPKWVTGKIGGALEFDGDDAVFLEGSVGTGSLLNIHKSDLTVSSWVKIRGKGGTIVARSKPLHIAYTLGVSTNKAYINTYKQGPGHWILYTDEILEPETWYHIVGVFDRVGDRGRVYVDGVEKAEGIMSTDPLSNDASTKIGCRNDTGDFAFEGTIDDVRIYNYALSHEEIIEICPPTVATKPQPANKGLVKPGNVKLSWKPGKDATAHRIYFGTNANELPRLAEVRTPSYSTPQALQRGVTYFWRVDEVQADGSVVTGDIWSFSTGKLVAWWKFDETSGGTAADSSGNNYHGRNVHGNPVWSPDGKFGGCLDFNERYGISIPKGVFGSVGPGITISVWVYGNEEQRKHSDVILQAGAGDDGKPYIVSIYTDWLDYGLKFATGFGEPDRLEFNPGAPEDWTGRWNHYAFVKDADKGFQRIYLNGSLVAEKTGAMASMSGVGAARIGIAPERFGDQYVGKLDDLRIYNYALSGEEIQQLCGIVPGLGPAVEPVEPGPPAPPVTGHLKGLVGHWKFDEGYGTKAYDSEGNNHGTIHGAQWTGGRVNGALYFDSREDYVSISPVTLSKNWTVSAWCEPLRNEVGGCNPIMGGPEDYDNYIILCEAKHHINLETDTDGDWVIVCKGAVDFNEWAYYTVTRNGNTISAYRNGVHIDDATLPKGGKNTITKIGSGYGAATYYKGRIDDVRIYNRALSAEEIQELYTQVSGFRPVAEVYLSDIDETSKASLIDLDTGKTRRIPDPLRHAGSDEAQRWMARQGLDLGAEFAGGEYGLIGFDVVATRIASEQWDKITPTKLGQILAAEPAGVEKRERQTKMPAKGEYPPTFAFKTREGGAGVLQIYDADRSKKTISFRHKMLEHPLEVGPAPPTVTGFGPVIEQVVYHGGSEYECLIDFETGKLFKVPEHLKGGENEEQALQWIEQTGVDAAGDTEGSMESRGLKGFPDDMAALPVPGGWDASPSLFVPTMRVFGPSGRARMFAKGGLPATYWFKTGEGNMGVLQILGFTEGKPRGVRIRYKMVQAEAEEGIIGIKLQKPAYEWWRVKPRVTYHIYEDAKLEVKWEVDLDSKTAKRIRAFAVGVLPIKEDISDLRAHYYREDDLAFTVRRTPYGKKWKVRERSSRVSRPKTLRPGEYRVYVCAFSRYRHGVSWSDMLSDVIGAGTAKLIVKPRPFTGAAAVDVVKREVFLPEDSHADLAKALELAEGLYGLYQGVVTAIENKDTDTALLLVDQLITNGRAFEQMVKGTSAEMHVKTGGKVLEQLRVALQQKQMDRAKSLINAFNQIGPPISSALERAVEQQERVNSAQKLMGLGKAVAIYANEHNGKLPATLQELKPYVGSDFQWLIENVRYFGKGQESEQPDTPIAYDETLLQKANGTNVLFLDAHVEFRQAEELTSVKRTIEHR